MLSRAIVAASVRSPFGVRMISGSALELETEEQWNSTNPNLRSHCLQSARKQWDIRGLHKTSITKVVIKGAGVHSSRDGDTVPHFTGRGYNAKGEAVWFREEYTKSFYTCAIHFYPFEFPNYFDNDRFTEIASDDPGLVAWCFMHGWNIKSGMRLV